jgi:polar amino acid transport system substrate-binding protein
VIKVIAMQETWSNSRIVVFAIALALLLAVDGCGPLNPGHSGISLENHTVIPSPSSCPGNTIVFSTRYLEDSVDFKTIELLYTEAFSRMGYDFKLIPLPPERSLADADAGRVDGEAIRNYHLLDGGQYPNLIRVDEWVLSMETAAYSVRATIVVSGWDSLAGTDYTFVIEHGHKAVQAELPKYVAPGQIVEVENVEQAIAMLEAGRADVFVGTATAAETILRRVEHQGSGVRKLGVINTGYGYPYLHTKHSDLVLPLAATLKEMKEDGTYQRLVGQD